MHVLSLRARGTLIAVLFTVGCASTERPSIDTVPLAAIAHQEGDTAAPIHVVYFTDYVCDDCAKFNKDAIEPLRAEWVAKKRARLTMVDLAWRRGSVAGSAAASCADEQRGFWPMHAMLFERQEVWKRAVDIPAKLREYAAELGLDTAAFARCAEQKAHRERLDAAEEATRTFGVRGTPAFVINGRLFYGSQRWDWVQKVLLAYEQGQPDSAPPPPFKIPTKSVVDSAKLKTIEDSLVRLRTPRD